MSRSRTRVRYDRFELRGYTYEFHAIRDQGKMAALVPETDEVRHITLWSDQKVEIRKGDLAIIYPQIGWALPGALTATFRSSPALDRAAEKVEAFKAAASASAPVSSADDNPAPAAEPEKVPQLLLPYIKVGETVREAVSRLNDELRIEFDAMTNALLGGAGERKLEGEATKTVSMRHEEISALLTELQELGAKLELGNG